MCVLRCREHQHVYERTAEWTATLHWSTVMPEQTTETNEPDWYKYILSTAWRDGFFRKGLKKFLLKIFLSRNNPNTSLINKNNLRIPNGVFIKNTQLYMFCVNESLKTVMSTVSGLGGERSSFFGASHPLINKMAYQTRWNYSIANKQKQLTRWNYSIANKQKHLTS